MRGNDWTGSFSATLVLAAGVFLLFLNAPAAPPQTNRPPTEAATPTPSQANQPELSALAAALVRMADAGISPEVIQAYVETAQPEAPLNDRDIIALKNHKVPDKIVNLAIQRAAKSGTERQQQRAQALASALAERKARYGGVDPESYDYFRSYYLHPRALAFAHQQLFRHPAGAYGYPGYPWYP